MEDRKGPEHSQVKQFALNGHSRPVKMVRYNKDGDMFFTCSDDKLIIAWSNEAAEKLGTYEGKGACKSLAVSRHTEYVVGGYAVEGVTIFEALTGDKVFDFLPSDGADKVNYVEFNYGDTELLVMINKSNGKSSIQIYDFNKLLNREKKVLKVFNFNEEVTQASYGYLNEKLYVSTNDGQMMVVDMATEKIEIQSKVHSPHQIFSFSFSKDFSMLASCGKEGKCKLLNPETLEVLKIYDKKSPCRCASFSPLFDIDSTGERYHILIGGGQDARDVTGTAETEGSFETRLYHVIYEEEMAQIKGHFGPVHSIQYSPDGRGFVTVSEDGTVRLQRFPLEYFEDF